MALRDYKNAHERSMSLGYHRAPDDPEKRRCRWCGGPVPRGRTSWCSPDCVHEGLLVAQPSYARRKVEERDRGVCAACGLDTARIERIVERLSKLAQATVYVREDDGTVVQNPWLPGENGRRCRTAEHPAADKSARHLDVMLAIIGLWAGHDVRKLDTWSWDAVHGHVRFARLKHSLWQNDHIKPVVEGGGQCGLDNMRTLCLRCHKDATKALAGRRAKARRPQQEMFE